MFGKSKKSKSKKNNKPHKIRKSTWKRIIIYLLIVLVVWLLLIAYENYKNSHTEYHSVGVIGGADGPTAVYIADDPKPVPVDTVAVDKSEKSEKVIKPAETLTAVPEKEKNEEKLNHISECDLNHEENSPLFFGNPSDASADVSLEKNYLMEKENYTLSYNNSTLCPNWVGWHLDADDIGDAPRSNKFTADKDLPEGWYGVTKADYQYNAYGFDRGHICPSADRTYSQEANEETFLMTNMVPQSPDNNRVVWVALEKYQREIVDGGNEVYIFAGPAGTGGIGDRGYFDYILLKGAGSDGGDLKINVPAYTWKILLVLPDGDDDLGRIDENTEIISVCIPNEKDINSDLSWKKYLCSVDYIEELTGYDFFELLDDELEEKLESSVISFEKL